MRFRQRHIQETIVKHLREGLTDLGWVVEPRNFGGPPLIFREVDRQERVARIEPNTLSIWIDREMADHIAELGGPLYNVDLDAVVDVYASSASVAVSIASDIKDLVRDRSIPLLNFAGPTPVQGGGTVGFDGAFIDRPAGDVNAVEFKGAWRVVALQVQVAFTD